MLNLINASGLIYAAVLYAVILTVQAIARNNRLQFAVVQCKTRMPHRSLNR